MNLILDLSRSISKLKDTEEDNLTEYLIKALNKKGGIRLILFVKITKEQKEALISEFSNIRFYVEQGLRYTADKIIKENKGEPSLSKKRSKWIREKDGKSLKPDSKPSLR